MIILISGPNNSGKSAFAEELITGVKVHKKYDGNLIYIATMICRNEENEGRIIKHKLRRKDMGFRDIEEPFDLDNVHTEPADRVLLEDLSNLLSNRIFDKGGSRQEVLEQLCRLEGRCDRLFIVTISGLDSEKYHGETASYINDLNYLNNTLSSMAQVHIEMKDYSPCYLKGSPNDVY